MGKSVCCDIEHHAVLFGLISKETINGNAEKGVEWIRSAVRRYGRERGARMAKRCMENGDPLTPQSYQAYNERSSRPGQMNSVWAGRIPEFIIHVEKCAWKEAWEKNDLLDYGKYYCLDIDRSLTKGFSKDYELRPEGFLSWGAPYCDMHWGFPMNQEAEVWIKEKRNSLKNGSVRDYSFHTGHLFSTLTEELVHLSGDEGQRFSLRALEAFCRIYSKEYIDSFSKAYPQSRAAQAVLSLLDVR